MYDTQDMSRTLQLSLPEEEIQVLERLAAREGVTVDEWVSRAVRQARVEHPAKTVEEKLKAIGKAAEYSFPTADIDQMVKEIEQGYQG